MLDALRKALEAWWNEGDRPSKPTRYEDDAKYIAEKNTRILKEHVKMCFSCRLEDAYPIPDTLMRYRCRSCGKTFNDDKHNLVNHKGQIVYDGTNGRWRNHA